MTKALHQRTKLGLLGLVLLGTCFVLFGLKSEITTATSKAVVVSPGQEIDPKVTATKVSDCPVASPFASAAVLSHCGDALKRPLDVVTGASEEMFLRMQAESSHFILDLLAEYPSDAELGQRLMQIPHANTDDWVALGIHLVSCDMDEAVTTARFADTDDPSCEKIQRYAHMLHKAIAKNPSIDEQIRAYKEDYALNIPPSFLNPP